MGEKQCGAFEYDFSSRKASVPSPIIDRRKAASTSLDNEPHAHRRARIAHGACLAEQMCRRLAKLIAFRASRTRLLGIRAQHAFHFSFECFISPCRERGAVAAFVSTATALGVRHDDVKQTRVRHSLSLSLSSRES